MESQDDDPTTVILNKCGLTEIPPISSEIKVLECRRNAIKVLSFPRDSLLEYLDISDNTIGSLDPVSGLGKLKTLDVGYNLLQSIPKLDLPALRELYLMSNDIKSIENMNFAEVIKCDLANNEIRVLDGIECLKLEEGYFGANHITSISDLRHLKSLRILDLQYNKLDELDCSLLPESIEVLLLNSNKKLERISNLGHLRRLKLLGIKNTNVGDIETNGAFEIW